MILRSLLFIPGHRARFYEKLAELRPDAVILDLEDAVPPVAKPIARQMIRERLGGGLVAGLRVFVRVNAIGTPFFRDDVRGVTALGLDGLLLPKVESPEQLREANMLLAQSEIRAGLVMGAVRLVPILETVEGVLRAGELARETPRVLGVAFGAEDFTLDLGVQRSADGLETRYPRASVALAARSAGVLAFDTPWTDIADPTGLARETREARQFGFTGKQAIHPSQIATINAAFSPSAEEVDAARRTVEAYGAAVARGDGAIQLDGKLIDVPMVERAKRVLAAQAELDRARRDDP
jgi:citrate lyase subunit beta / citryl-CoA lyase